MAEHGTAHRMAQSQGSWLQQLTLWVSDRLLAPSRRRRGRWKDLLQERLEALLLPMVGRGEAGLAILEGALALAEADGEFRQEEWALFERGMASLQLTEQQRQQLSLHGAIDLNGVGASLEAIADPAQRRAIAGFYGLLAAADGQRGPAELAVLRPLLRALDAAALEDQVPQLADRHHATPGWLERLAIRLGADLARWAGPRRFRR